MAKLENEKSQEMLLAFLLSQLVIDLLVGLQVPIILLGMEIRTVSLTVPLFLGNL